MPESPTGPPPPPAHDAPVPAACALASGVRFLGGVPYAAVPGIRPLELDLWLPPVRAAAPVVVFLHGGGWRVGSRRTAGPAYADAAVGPFEQMALAGIAVASADYRLSGEARWPAQLHDAKAAVRWLRCRAADLGIDADRIAAWGESAGGQLAEMLGLTGDRADFEGTIGITGPTSAVTAVAAWYAPSDIAAVATDNGQDPTDPDTREALMLGAPAVTVPDIARAASPVAHVTPGAPPFLLLHGTSDVLIPGVQSERLRQALTAVGVPVELHRYEGADHMWRGAPEAAQDALARTISFFRRHLGIDAARSTGGSP